MMRQFGWLGAIGSLALVVSLALARDGADGGRIETVEALANLATPATGDRLGKPC